MVRIPTIVYSLLRIPRAAEYIPLGIIVEGKGGSIGRQRVLVLFDIRTLRQASIGSSMRETSPWNSCPYYEYS